MIKTNVTNIATEPLTERRGDAADYIIGGALANPLDAISQKLPIIGNNRILRGVAQIAIGYGLTKVKTGSSGELVKHAKTGTEIAFAVTGTANVVGGVANYFGNRNTAKAEAATKTTRRDKNVKW